jgi:hypothetical protein
MPKQVRKLTQLLSRFFYLARYYPIRIGPYLLLGYVAFGLINVLILGNIRFDSYS